MLRSRLRRARRAGRARSKRPPSADVTPSIVPLSGGVGSPKSGSPSASRAPSAPVTESRKLPAWSSRPSSRLGPAGGGGGGLSRSAMRYSISSGRAALCSKRSVSITTYWISVAVTMSATNVTGSPARNFSRTSCRKLSRSSSPKRLPPITIRVGVAARSWNRLAVLPGNRELGERPLLDGPDRGDVRDLPAAEDGLHLHERSTPCLRACSTSASLTSQARSSGSSSPAEPC